MASLGHGTPTQGRMTTHVGSLMRLEQMSYKKKGYGDGFFHNSGNPTCGTAITRYCRGKKVIFSPQ